MSVEYAQFLERKARRVNRVGFEPGPVSSALFPFQADLARWAVRRGRAAVFAATGLGKTRIELEWARHVARHTGGPVLVLAPLAVAPQMVEEGARIGLAVTHARDGAEVSGAVTVTNYDRLHRFDPSAFAGVVLDESSCIKHQHSKTLAALLAAFERTPYRLSATATPAPNDYTELGTQAEFLGIATRTEMLSEFFVHDGGETQVWRLKRHARRDYWRWVASWAALVRRPSDLGCDDAGYDLPELTVRHHVAPASQEETFAMGRLFAAEAGDLSERRAARRGSIGRRVEMCAEVVNAEPSEPWIVWCDLNAESEALARAIPGAVEVRGSDDIDEKERRLTAFATGGLRVLVTKPSIAGHGLNLQRCARVAFVGVTDSWELYHQAVRRVWRFGQSRPVDVHVFASEAEGSVLSNLERKETDAAQMAEELSVETRDAVRENVRGRVHKQAAYVPRVAMEIPEWLGGAR
jgi:superfamily II DNA or RNA helicase